MLVGLALISGCNADPRAADMASVKADAEVTESQKGRWQFVEAKPPYPAILFDTATGCVKTLEFLKNGQNAGTLARFNIAPEGVECTDLPVVRPRLKNKTADMK